MSNDEKCLDVSLFLNHIISNSQSVVRKLFFDCKEQSRSTSIDAIKKILNANDDDATIISCTALLLLVSETKLKGVNDSQEMELLKIFHLSIFGVVINTLTCSNRELIERSMIFWESINILLDDSKGKADALTTEETNETPGPMPTSEGERPTVILFGCSEDPSEIKIRMECPPLTELRRMAPELANQVSPSQI